MQELQLRQLCDEDVAMLTQWLYAPHVAAWFHAPQDWLDEVKKRNAEFAFIHHFIAEAAGKPVGFCQYYEYRLGGEDWHGDTDLEGTYSMDYLIGDPSNLGKGYGGDIVRALIERIRAEGAKRIIVDPAPENQASCRTLLSCGFTFNAQNALYLLEL